MTVEASKRRARVSTAWLAVAALLTTAQPARAVPPNDAREAATVATGTRFHATVGTTTATAADTPSAARDPVVGSGAASPPPGASTDRPDPCVDAAAPCKSAAFGPVSVFSTKTRRSVTTTASHQDGRVFGFEWIRVKRGVTELVVTFPDEPPSAAVRLESGLPTLKGANMAAAAFIGLGPDSTALQPLVTAVPGSNHAGCDVIDDWVPGTFSCTFLKGRCCDKHDRCIDKYCQPPDSGNVARCWPFRCSFRCNLCHHRAIACMSSPILGRSKCCKRKDCGKEQWCISEAGAVLTSCEECETAGLLRPDDVCAADPTFIQVSRRDPPVKSRGARAGTAPGVGSPALVAEIAVPWDDALVRADVPVFGLAYGDDFAEYRVEVGEGPEPVRWTLIATSKTPQSQPVTELDVDDRSNVTIRGSLATWDTGLKNYVYLPSHPEDHPVDLSGTHVVRLTVVGRSGATAEDRVTVTVGDVIPNAWGGRVRSGDGRVVLTVPEHALTHPFRVVAVQPAAAPPGAPATGRRIVGPVYEMREEGEPFAADALLEMGYDEGLDAEQVDRLGMFGFDTTTGRWHHLPSVRGPEHRLRARVRRLDGFYALMASPVAAERAAPGIASAGAPRRPVDGRRDRLAPLVRDTFERAVGEWTMRDREAGGTVDLVPRDRGGRALRVANGPRAGDFAVTAVSTPWDVSEYPIVEFDYRIPPGVKTDLYAKVAGRWYALRLTDDPQPTAYQRVNIASIGAVDGVVADDRWHSARVNLHDRLRTKTHHTRVDEVVLADWDVLGFMKLAPGQAPPGAAYYVDDFTIRRDDRAAAARARGDVVVDDFEQQTATNVLGRETFVFRDAVGGTVLASFDPAPGGCALALTYDVEGPGRFVGYASRLGGLDARRFAGVRIALRGDTVPEGLLIGLRDGTGHEGKVQAARYARAVDGERQLVEVPLVAFPGLEDRRSMENVSVAVEFSDRPRGTVAIEEVRFAEQLGMLRVDDFESADGRNLLGGVSESAGHGGAWMRGARVPREDGTALQLSYGGPIGEVRPGSPDPFSWAGWSTALRGTDCRDCESLVLRVRGTAGGERPNVYLNDGNHRWGVAIDRFGPVTPGWQTFVIPVAVFERGGVDVSHLHALELVFEWERAHGALLVDDIRFEKRGAGDALERRWAGRAADTGRGGPGLALARGPRPDLGTP